MFFQYVRYWWMLRYAGQCAQAFLNSQCMPFVRQVALGGSLARREDRLQARDIDLVIFHDGSLKRSGHKIVPCCSPERPYHLEFPPEFTRALTRRDHCLIKRMLFPLDTIFLDERVLSDCTFLQSVPDGIRRVVCTHPLLEFNPGTRRFDKLISHGDHPTCGPTDSWDEIAREKERIKNMIPTQRAVYNAIVPYFD